MISSGNAKTSVPTSAIHLNGALLCEVSKPNQPPDGAGWSNVTTYGGVKSPRAQRREEERRHAREQKQQRLHGEFRLRTPDQAHAAMVRKIRRQQAAANVMPGGATLPGASIDDEPRGENAQGVDARSWLGFAADVLASVLDSASQSIKWPNLGIGAAAASTDEPGRCDANGICDSASPARERSSVSELVAGAGEHFTVTLSKAAQRDAARSLKGCTVLLGQSSHTSGTVKENVKAIADRHFVEGDRWLTEDPHHLLVSYGKQLQDEACRGIPVAAVPGGPGCTGIESVQESRKSDAISTRYGAAMHALLQFVQAAAPQICQLKKPLDAMNYLELTDAYLEVQQHFLRVDWTGEQKASLMNMLRDLQPLLEAFLPTIDSEMDGRNRHFSRMVAQYSAPQHTTWVDLGSAHTSPVMDILDDGKRCIVELDHT